MAELLALMACALGSFLLGSSPWGVIVSEAFFHTDVRDHGSGNIGTTNALRTMGKVGGGAVFLLDFGKGLAAGFIAWALARLLIDPAGGFALVSFDVMKALAFLGCVTGHIFPPWLGFKGGKGVAVAVGCLFVTFGPLLALVEIAVFALVVALSRHVSAGSIAAACACVPCALGAFWGQPAPVCLCVAAALLVVWAHRGNIARLRAHAEPRVGQ